MKSSVISHKLVAFTNKQKKSLPKAAKSKRQAGPGAGVHFLFSQNSRDGRHKKFRIDNEPMTLDISQLVAALTGPKAVVEFTGRVEVSYVTAASYYDQRTAADGGAIVSLEVNTDDIRSLINDYVTRYSVDDADTNNNEIGNLEDLITVLTANPGMYTCTATVVRVNKNPLYSAGWVRSALNAGTSLDLEDVECELSFDCPEERIGVSQMAYNDATATFVVSDELADEYSMLDSEDDDDGLGDERDASAKSARLRARKAASRKRIADAMRMDEIIWEGDEPLTRDEYKTVMRRNVTDSEYDAYTKKFADRKKKAARTRTVAASEYDKDLSRWGAKAFLTAWEAEPDDAMERSRFVAHTVGAYAARLGMTPEDVTKWLQSAYSNIFVKGNRLNPGMDLKEVRAEILKALTKAQSRQKNEARVRSAGRLIKFPEGIMTEEDWVLRYADRVEQYKRSPSQFFNRTKFNRLSGDEQEEYEKRLENRAAKPGYAAWRGDVFYDISKATYDKTKSLKGASITKSRVKVSASRKRVADKTSADWYDIVQHFADTVWDEAVRDAQDEATGEGGRGEHAEVPLDINASFYADMPDAFVAVVEKDIIDAWGKDAILADFAKFEKKNPGRNAAGTYGSYLCLGDMGHGVSLRDHGHETALKSHASSAENVQGWLTKTGDGDALKIFFNIEFAGYHDAVDITSQVINDLADSVTEAATRTAAATADWDELVKNTAISVFGATYADAVEEAADPRSEHAEESYILSKYPWGGGDDILDYLPEIPDAFTSKVAAELEATYGKDELLADCSRYMSEGYGDEESYGHALGLQSMGHGVNVEDDGFESSLKKKSYPFEHIGGYVYLGGTEDDVKVLFDIDNIEVDVTDQLQHLVLKADDDAVEASVKTAGDTWTEIVKAFADAVWDDRYYMAVEQHTESSNYGESIEVVLDISTSTTAGPTPPEFVKNMDKAITAAWGKDNVLADYKAFSDLSGESAETYGHYLATQEMGTGVGLRDYKYESKLKEHKSGVEHIYGWFTREGDKVLYHVERPHLFVDVTDDVVLADEDEATEASVKTAAGGYTMTIKGGEPIDLTAVSAEDVVNALDEAGLSSRQDHFKSSDIVYTGDFGDVSLADWETAQPTHKEDTTPNTPLEAWIVAQLCGGAGGVGGDGDVNFAPAEVWIAMDQRSGITKPSEAEKFVKDAKSFGGFDGLSLNEGGGDANYFHEYIGDNYGYLLDEGALGKRFSEDEIEAMDDAAKGRALLEYFFNDSTWYTDGFWMIEARPF